MSSSTTTPLPNEIHRCVSRSSCPPDHIPVPDGYARECRFTGSYAGDDPIVQWVDVLIQ